MLSLVREAHDSLMGISGVKPWLWPDCKSALPPIIPLYNLTDHIPQIAGSACGPAGSFSWSMAGQHSPPLSPSCWAETEKGKKGSGVRCDRSNSLGRTRNSVVSAVTSRFGATASHYRKQASPVTPSAQISAENVFGQKDQPFRNISWKCWSKNVQMREL